jgi:hypothetical protein
MARATLSLPRATLSSSATEKKAIVIEGGAKRKITQ